MKTSHRSATSCCGEPCRLATLVRWHLNSLRRSFQGENALTRLLTLWIRFNARAPEARIGDQFRNLIPAVEVKYVRRRFAPLPLMDRANRDCDEAVRPQYASDFAQARRRVAPKVDAVNGECAIKRIIRVRQCLNVSPCEIDSAIRKRRRIAFPSHLHHGLGAIDSRHLTTRCPLGGILNRHARPEANFEHTRVRPDGEQIDGPTRFSLVMTRHAPADHPTEQASGLAKLPRYIPRDHWAASW